MSTLYVDNIAPNLGSQVEIPNFKPLAGSVVQVVQGNYTGPVTNNSSTYVDTNIAASITPTATSSKILIQAVVPFQLGTNGGTGQLQFRIMRDATPLTSNIAVNNVQYIVQLADTQSISWLDAPNTTSATTYKIQFRELSMANRYGSSVTTPTWNDTQTGTIHLMEIAQ